MTQPASRWEVSTMDEETALVLVDIEWQGMVEQSN